MRYRRFIVLLIAYLGLLSAPMVQAKEGYDHIAWTKRANTRTGLYTTRNYFVSNGFTLNLAALYYFGDVDNEGLAFHGGFNPENIGVGGGLSFTYQIPAGNHCNLRFSAMSGLLRANNELRFKNLPEPRDDYRRFRSIFVQPAFGVQYYPFSNAGFYVYGGVALTASIITDYEFYYYKRVGNGKERTKLNGNTYGLLPMVQLGIGYSWVVSDSWTMSAEIMVQEGLVDMQYLNLDAWPLASSQNKEGVELGSSGRTYIGKNGQESLHWNDGWFQVGILVSYHWRNCETCRLNTYYNVRRRSR